MSPPTQDVVNERSKAWPPLPLVRGIETVEHEPDQRTLTRRLTDEAIGYIERHKDQPLFMYLAHPMPHVPLHVSEQFQGRSERGLYGDVIMELDWSVGQVLDAIKRLGLDEQTLVIFASDNGPWLAKGDRGGTCNGLRDGKATQFEGATRVPCIMRWPGNIAPGTTCDALATIMDLLPTAAVIAGSPLPSDGRIDGRDISPLILGQNARLEPRTHYHYLGQHLRAVRHGPWKLHVAKGPQMELEIPSLFNLERDLGETRNVADQHPQIVEQLQALAEQAREDLGDLASRRTGKNLRPPGRLDQ